jgi:hypothetical protein
MPAGISLEDFVQLERDEAIEEKIADAERERDAFVLPVPPYGSRVP